MPAITLRVAPVQLFGSGIGGPANLTDAAAAYRDLLQLVAAGEISVDIDPVLLRRGQAWARPEGQGPKAMATTQVPAPAPPEAPRQELRAGLLDYLTTVDHKKIGILYLYTAFGGLLHRPFEQG